MTEPTMLFTLALQESQPASPQITVPGVPGEAPPAAAPATGAPGGGARQPPPSGLLHPMNLIFVVLIMMVLMMTMGGRKERRKREALLKSLKKHDRVQTSGGIIGTVVEIKDDELTLRVDEGSNTRIRFARSAVVAVLRAAAGRDESGSEVLPVENAAT